MDANANTSSEPDSRPRPRWTKRWWGVPVLLLCGWQVLALGWGLLAWLVEPDDPPLPPDPPAFADWFQAIRNDVPPDGRLEAALQQVRDTVVVPVLPHPPPPDQTPPHGVDEAASATPPPAERPPQGMALGMDGMGGPFPPPPPPDLDPESLWRKYDATADPVERIDLLAQLGTAYGVAGEGYAADTCRLAGVWMAREQPAQRRYLLRVLGCSGQMYDYVRVEPLIFPARRLLAQLDRDAYRTGRLAEQLRREAEETAALREADRLHPSYPPYYGESWHTYGEALAFHGARRAARAEYRLELEAVLRRHADGATDWHDGNEQAARVELAQLHWQARQYPQAYWVISGLPLSERFQGSGLSCSYRWAARTYRLVYGSAALSGPVPLLLCVILRPLPVWSGLLVAAVLMGLLGWWLRRLFRPRWTPVFEDVDNDTPEPDGGAPAPAEAPEEEPKRYCYHDARWGPLFWCHLPALLVMLAGIGYWARWTGEYEWAVLFGALLTGWSAGCVWLWPLWIGCRDNQLEISRDGIATSAAFVRWEKIKRLEADPGEFTAGLLLSQRSKPRRLIQMSIPQLPLAHPAAQALLMEVRRRRPDLPCPGVEETLARLRERGDRPTWKGVLPLILLAAGFGLLLLLSPLSLRSHHILPHWLPVGLEALALALTGLGFCLFVLSFAILQSLVRPPSRAGRWVVGVCQVTTVLPLYLMAMVLFPDVPRWIPTALYGLGMMLPLAALLLLYGADSRTRLREAVVIALLLAVPVAAIRLEGQQRQQDEIAFPRVRLAGLPDLEPALLMPLDQQDRWYVAGRFHHPPEAWIIDRDLWRLGRRFSLADAAWVRLDRDGRRLVQIGRRLPVRSEDRAGDYNRAALTVIDLETAIRRIQPLGPTAKFIGPRFLSPDRTQAAWLEQAQDGHIVRRREIGTGQDTDDTLPPETDWGKHLLRDGSGWLPDGTLVITAKLVSEPEPTPDNPRPYTSGPYRLIRWLRLPDGGTEVLRTNRSSSDWTCLPDARRVLRHTGRPTDPDHYLSLRQSVVDGFGQEGPELATRYFDFRLVTRPDVPWVYQLVPDGHLGNRLVADDWITGDRTVSMPLPLPLTSRWAKLDAVSPDGRWAVVVDVPIGIAPVRLLEIPTGRVTPLRIEDAGRPVTLRWYDYEPDGTRYFTSDSRYLILPAWDDLEGRRPTLYRITLPSQTSPGDGDDGISGTG